MAASIWSAPRERIIYLYATQECTLRCAHCYVGNERLDAATRFSLEEFTSTLEYFATLGGYETLYLLGGEPTLHPDLPEMVHRAKAMGFNVAITTNGDFHPRLFDKIPPTTLRSFNFSVESAEPEVHFLIRGSRKNHPRVLERIRMAVERGYVVRMTCTVTRTNVHTALGMMKLAGELGVHNLAFHNTGLTGNARSDVEALRPEDWVAFREAIEATPPVEGLNVFYPPAFVRAEDQAGLVERGYPGCPARSFDRPHVYPGGRVYACPLLMDGDRHYGTLTHGKFRLNVRPDNEMNGHLSVNEACRGCPSSPTCGGGCPAYDSMPAYTEAEWFRCDRKLTPVCMLWTTYAWNRPPSALHKQFR